MAEFPSLPLFTDAWVADTKHLERPERDIYLHLLILMWRSPGCKVPNDEAWLVKRLDIREKDGTEILRRIITEFCISDGNRIFQKRLLAEFEYCQRQSVRRKGKKNNKKSGNREPPADCAPNPNPNPNPTSGGNARKRAARLPDDFIVPKEWRDEAKGKRAEHRLAPVDLDLEAEKFANFWLAKPGQQGAKLDWHRTWLNWALNAHPEKLVNGKGMNGSAPKRWTPPAYGSEEWKRDQRRMGLLNDGE